MLEHVAALSLAMLSPGGASRDLAVDVFPTLVVGFVSLLKQAGGCTPSFRTSFLRLWSAFVVWFMLLCRRPLCKHHLYMHACARAPTHARARITQTHARANAHYNKFIRAETEGK